MMERENEAIRELEDRRYQAMIDGDAAALGELLADDLIYTHSSARLDDKKSYIGSIASGTLEYRKVSRHDETIRVSGDAALITGRVEIDAVLGGAERHLVSRYLNVWLKRGGRWQLAAWQSTPVPAT
ncbi:MAG: nuclear transport factor 2 family protein [Thermodesulfobacteriota bacterium]